MTQPADPSHAQNEVSLAKALEMVVAGQLATPLLQEVVTMVEVTKNVEVTRVLLSLGLKTMGGGAEVPATVWGILLSVAEAGATGPVRRTEVSKVVVAVGIGGSKSPRLWTWSSTLAQLYIWMGRVK